MYKTIFTAFLTIIIFSACTPTNTDNLANDMVRIIKK